jgi:hypothetical protein
MGVDDLEHGRDLPTPEKAPYGDGPALGYDGAPADTGLLARLRGYEALMDRKLGIESEAIDRKRAEDKKPAAWWEEATMGCLWASGTMNLSCFATGFLGWEFGLSLKQSVLICIFGSLLGGSVTGFCATFGAPTGLRQMSVSRFRLVRPGRGSAQLTFLLRPALDTGRIASSLC